MSGSETILSVAVHGAAGRLGRLIVKELQEAGDLRYAGPVVYGGEVPACEIVIDVSSAEGTRSLLGRLATEALVVGTTGELPVHELELYARRAPVCICPNFSAGIPLLSDLLERALASLPDGWNVEIIEAHHSAKKDAPSGTARRLAAVVEAVGGAAPPTHSLRVGDTVGEHTVWLSGPGERLELKHVATRREVFAIGALRSARWVAVQPSGLYRL